VNLGSLENLEDIWQVLGSFRKYSRGFHEGILLLEPTSKMGYRVGPPTPRTLGCRPALKSCVWLYFWSPRWVDIVALGSASEVPQSELFSDLYLIESSGFSLCLLLFR